MKLDPKKIKSILSKYILADGFDPIIDFQNSYGSYLVDERNGDEYLDMFSMFASGAIGYNHPGILKNKDLLGDVAIHKTTLSDIYNKYYVEFLEKFSDMAMPEYLNRAFFIDGGALAVENALKIAFDWKVRKNIDLGLGENLGTKVIHFNQAFHGRSGYTLTLTNTSDPRKTMYFPKFDWPRVSNPYLSFPINDDVLKQVIMDEKKSIDEINLAINENKNDIAALIIEPIQGEGGDNFFRDEFFISLKEICNENEILLIFDEVQTGIGITGKMWAHEHYSVEPDILSFGKKTQVCGVIAGERISEVENNVFVESSRINSTFGGNLVDMVRFKLTLDIISKENLLDNATNMGKYLLGKIMGLEEEFPAYVSNSRGLGLWAAFDLPSTSERDELWVNLLKNKLLILTSGDRSIRFRPHLNVTSDDIDLCITIIRDTIKKTLK